jgi:hypothetical protein
MRTALLAFALSLVISPAFAHDKDNDGDENSIEHVNGSISAEAGHSYDDLSTVNGGISLDKGAKAKEVSTVNGGLSLDDNVEVVSLETVNGGITAGENCRIEKDVDTVNGGIRITFHSRVGGEVGTVNGGITVQQTEVGGQVKTVNGDITIGAQSIVHGGILVEKPHGFGIHWGKASKPRIVIGPNAVVEGELRFEREVDLFVHTTAKIGKVTGATAQSYTDKLPPRL